jgi:hypothetical protein
MSIRGVERRRVDVAGRGIKWLQGKPSGMDAVDSKNAFVSALHPTRFTDGAPSI